MGGGCSVWRGRKGQLLVFVVPRAGQHGNAVLIKRGFEGNRGNRVAWRKAFWTKVEGEGFSFDGFHNPPLFSEVFPFSFLVKERQW